MCTGRLFVSPVPPGLRGFLAVVARRGVWRLPVFFVVTGASEPGSGSFESFAVFFGTAVQWLNDFNSFIVHRLVRKCFLVLIKRLGKLRKI